MMDTLRGQFQGPDAGDDRDFDLAEDDVGGEAPPAAVGQDERRMQVRAYNHWASLLHDRNFPSIEDLDPENLPDFGPHSVVLDFTSGIEDPAIQFLGRKLAEECGSEGAIRSLADVPARSLLSRITDHYMQILANQAPIGFEAEFVNQRGATILYRGILLPFSSDDETIDFIYGVINWKEMADQETSDSLLLEIGQALEELPPAETPPAVAAIDLPPMPEWADGPTEDNILELVTPYEAEEEHVDWPAPSFGDPASRPAPLAPSRGAVTLEMLDAQVSHVSFDDNEPTALEHSGAERPAVEPAADPEALAPEPVAAEALNLADWLASAREFALAAKRSDDRSRQALYAAIGRAYDFSLAAAAQPAEFQELLADAGLAAQDRAPMTPVVKLVFGADYDKTRLAEYASALAHAHRLGLTRGALAEFIEKAEGGLKGVVSAERRLKRGETAPAVVARRAPAETLARKLRKLDPRALDDVAAEGSEFTLLVARRTPEGEVVLLGEVADDVALLERAARRLVA